MACEKSALINQAYRFSIAPMMDCTDRHFRVLMRQISQRSLLYTEMVVAKALHHSSNRKKLLDFDDIEHPISLQVGGDDPNLLADAARMAADWGYDEINLNVGCPSPRVKAGNFGACLMAQPKQVAKCIEAMSNASLLPVTIKHRIGIDDLDSDLFLTKFVDSIAEAGAKRFAIHARKALLKGLNPKENRSIPPLQYDKVKHLKIKRPDLIIELNGGLLTPHDCLNALKIFDGAMVGRAAYSHPLIWKNIDELIFNEEHKEISASKVLRNLIPYTEKYLENNGRIWNICKHTLQLIQGFAGAKSLRQEISVKAQSAQSDISILKKTAQTLEMAGL